MITPADYAADGAYFVTLFTHTRECLFGEIINDEMVLSEYGKIVVEEWERSASIREEIELGVYVVMPNHFHGIVHIFENKNPPHVGAYGHTELTTGIRRGDRPVATTTDINDFLTIKTYDRPHGPTPKSAQDKVSLDKGMSESEHRVLLACILLRLEHLEQE